MNTFLPEYWDDKVYYYAHQVEQDAAGGWTIRVDPRACLVRDDRFDIDEVAQLPTVNALRAARTVRTSVAPAGSASKCTAWRGRILLSGGTVLHVDSRLLLLQRDAAAPVDPLLWTSAAGRCDREPHLTSVKEFYEELLITANGTPVFVQLPGCETYADELKRVYERTCGGKGVLADANRWIRLQATAVVATGRSGTPWKLVFGDGSDAETYEGRGFVFFDETFNTLEIRLVAALDSAGHDLEYRDGEAYERPARLFTPDQLKQVDLVSTMARFVEPNHGDP